MKMDKTQTPKVPGKLEMGGSVPVPDERAVRRPQRERRCRQDARELGPRRVSVLTHAPQNQCLH